MADEYADSPVVFVGVATPASASSDLSVGFPSGVDLADLTYALYDCAGASSYGFVIDEEGKVVFGHNLGYFMSHEGASVSVFTLQARSHLEGAGDPFGIDEVPRGGKQTYEALKYGQFDAARAYAKQLELSKDADPANLANLNEFAGKVIKAVEEYEKSRLKRIEALADEGRAGEVEAEIEAFVAAFPRAEKSELQRLSSKAKRNGGDEALAAADFKEVVALLKTGSSTTMAQAKTLAQALVARFGSTYCGKLAQALLEDWP